MRVWLGLGTAVLAACGLTASSPAPARDVPRLYTIAGSGSPGGIGDGGPAAFARIRPRCVAGMADGSVLVGGGGRVRRIRRDGRIVTVARVRGCALAALPDGGFLVADASGNRLRRVGRDGRVTLVAGTGERGAGGDGGPAIDAQLEAPGEVAVRGDGSIFVLSKGMVRRIRRDGRIETFAGLPSACEGAHGQYATGVWLSPTAVAATPDGGLLLSDSDQDGCILRVSADGRIHVAARGFAAGSLVPAPDGGFLAAAWDAIWRIERGGKTTIVAGCEARPCAAGDGPARSADLEGADALVAEPGGGFVLAEPQRVARVDASGMLTTIAHVGGPSLARGMDGGLLLAHPDAGGDAPAGSVLRIGLDGAVTVVAGGGPAVPRAGLPALAVTLRPVQVQALPDGFAVLDGDRRIVMVGAGGTVARVIPAAGASAFAMLPDGGVVAVRRSQRDDASRAQRLLPNGTWTTLAGGPLAPARGVPASSVQILGEGGFALIAGGRLMVQQDEHRQIWVGRDGRIERTTRLGLGIDPVVSGPGGSALFNSFGEVRSVAADRSIATVAGDEANAGENGGFFGSTDGQPARFAELSGELALGPAGRGGGVLIGQEATLGEEGDEVGRVLWVAPSRTRRLGVAITRRSLPLLQDREIAIRTTVPARVELLARRGRRVVGRARTTVQAGETPVALPRRLTAGEVVVVVRATARDGQRAWTSHRFLFGSRLPVSTARRIIEGRACRRYTGRRVVCVKQETIEGSNFTDEYCVAVALVLKPNGVVYANGFDNEGGRCDRRRVARLLKRRPIWSTATEAPPL